MYDLNHKISRVCQVVLVLLAGFAVVPVVLSAVRTAPRKTSSGASLLGAKIAAMRRVHTWRAAFVCEKKLAILRHPFVSSGVMAIARPDRVRFATLRPYVSCIILAGNHIFMRSQTSRHWRKAGLSRRQSLGYIMRQLALWSLGHARHIRRDYQVSLARTAWPSAPSNFHIQHARTERPSVAGTVFTLIPRSKVLAQAVRNIQLGFAPHSSKLAFIQIQAVKGDSTRYWLSRQEINPKLPRGYFKPGGAP